MRTIKITKNIYKFSELSSEAKHNAIQKYRDSNPDLSWQDENMDSLKKFAEIFPIKLTKAFYGDRGEGVSYYFDCNYVENLCGQRLATFIWNNYSNEIYSQKYYKSWSSNKKIIHKKVKSKIQPSGNYWNVYKGLFIIEGDCILTGYYMDDVLLKEIYDFVRSPDNRNFNDLLNHCFDNWISAGNADIEKQNSDEYIVDILIDEKFDENGTMIY